MGELTRPGLVVAVRGEVDGVECTANFGVLIQCNVRLTLRVVRSTL